MERWAGALALVVAVSASTAGCSLLPAKDHGRYHSLPKTCDELLAPRAVHDALARGMHQDVLGSAKTTGSPNTIVGDGIDCDVTAERQGYEANASFVPGKPRARMLHLAYTRYKADYVGDDSAATAHRFLRPDKQFLMGADLEERAGLGDEAVAWWDTMMPLQAKRQIAFRVSNVKVEVRLGGGDDLPDSRDSLTWMDNPELREKLDGEVTGIAQAIAIWLRDDWKG